jgi:hypothetical protein
MGTTTLRRVPWTCRWGRFGGDIDTRRTPAPGFVFWTCVNTEAHTRVLARDECENCPSWEPAGEQLK